MDTEKQQEKKSEGGRIHLDTGRVIDVLKWGGWDEGFGLEGGTPSEKGVKRVTRWSNRP